MTPDQRDRIIDRLCAAGMTVFFIAIGYVLVVALTGRWI